MKKEVLFTLKQLQKFNGILGNTPPEGYMLSIESGEVLEYFMADRLSNNGEEIPFGTMKCTDKLKKEFIFHMDIKDNVSFKTDIINALELAQQI